MCDCIKLASCSSLYSCIRNQDGMQEIRRALDVYEKQMLKKEAELAKKKELLNAERMEWAAERRGWEEEKERVKQTKLFEKVVTLDVGGTKYRTTVATLTKYPDSMLGVMFSGRHDLPQQEDGSYFIDRDGELFKYIIMYLRDHALCLSVFPTFSLSTLLQLKAEFEYLQLHSDEVNSIINTCRISGDPYHFDLCHLIQSPAQMKVHFGTMLGQQVVSSTVNVKLEYSGVQINCSHQGSGNVIKVNGKYNGKCEEVLFRGSIELTNCNLSGARFVKCSFQGSASFEGCVMLDTVFDQVEGLVSKQVHFTPWQVTQAKFEPELLRALQEAGCIYD